MNVPEEMTDGHGDELWPWGEPRAGHFGMRDEDQEISVEIKELPTTPPGPLSSLKKSRPGEKSFPGRVGGSQVPRFAGAAPGSLGVPNARLEQPGKGFKVLPTQTIPCFC